MIISVEHWNMVRKEPRVSKMKDNLFFLLKSEGSWLDQSKYVNIS